MFYAPVVACGISVISQCFPSRTQHLYLLYSKYVYHVAFACMTCVVMRVWTKMIRMMLKIPTRNPESGNAAQDDPKILHAEFNPRTLRWETMVLLLFFLSHLFSNLGSTGTDWNPLCSRSLLLRRQVLIIGVLRVKVGHSIDRYTIGLNNFRTTRCLSTISSLTACEIRMRRIKLQLHRGGQ